MKDANRGRVAATLFLAFLVLTGWLVVAVVVGGPTTLYFALGLPAAAAFIASVISAVYGPPGPRRHA